jgi:hypothetical protein
MRLATVGRGLSRVAPNGSSATLIVSFLLLTPHAASGQSIDLQPLAGHTACTVVAAPPGRYYVRVRARNDIEEGDSSNEVISDVLASVLY